MSKIVKIYCEGKKGSHDYDILELVLDGLEGNWQIQPIGSKKVLKVLFKFTKTKPSKLILNSFSEIETLIAHFLTKYNSHYAINTFILVTERLSKITY